MFIFLKIILAEHPMTLNPEYSGNHTLVEHLISENGLDMHVLQQMFDRYTIKKLLTITPERKKDDILRWIDDPQGKFTSKSLYNLLDNKQEQVTDDLAVKFGV